MELGWYLFNFCFGHFYNYACKFDGDWEIDEKGDIHYYISDKYVKGNIVLSTIWPLTWTIIAILGIVDGSKWAAETLVNSKAKYILAGKPPKNIQAEAYEKKMEYLDRIVDEP